MLNRREQSRNLFRLRRDRRTNTTQTPKPTPQSNIVTKSHTLANSCPVRYSFLIKLASRGRPTKLKEVIDLYLGMSSMKHDITIAVTLDTDDVTCADFDYKDPRVVIMRGTSTDKINAINRDMDVLDGWDILINASDDMIPVQLDYDEIIAYEMYKNWPNLDGALHFYEGIRKDIALCSIMGVNLYKKFNYIYYPGYKSFYCDDEFSNVCKELGRFTFIDNTIVEHQHPDNQKAEDDDTYRRNGKFGANDRDLYHKRCQLKGVGGQFNFEYPEILLSILIPTLESRRTLLSRILKQLNDQINKHPNCSQIEILIDSDNGERTTGAKRDALIKKAKGAYVVFVDDDDAVASDYIEQIMPHCIDKQVDCVQINGIMTVDGQNPREFKHSIKYVGWYEHEGVYYRCPNHLNPTRRELALQVGYGDKTVYEDKDYSLKIADKLKTEGTTTGHLYHYLAVTKREPTANTIKVSIPVKNEDNDTLLKTIQSVMNANVKPSVIRIADDNDSENQLDPAIFKDIPKVEITRSMNAPQGAGPTKHWNGWVPKFSDLVIILDSHVEVPGDYADTLIDNLGAAVGWTIAPSKSTTPIPNYYGVVLYDLLDKFGPQSDSSKLLNGPLGGALCLTGDILYRVGGYCPDLIGFGLEEPWLAVRLAAAGIGYNLINKPIKHVYREEGRKVDSASEGSGVSSLYNHLFIVECLFPGKTSKLLERYSSYFIDKYGKETINAAAKLINETDSSVFNRWVLFFKYRRERLSKHQFFAETERNLN